MAYVGDYSDFKNDSSDSKSRINHRNPSNRIWMRIGYVSLFVLATSSIVSRAADNDVITDSEVVIKHEGGHRLLLPKDWPIEHEHGVISPVPVEQYLSLKFDQVQERFNRIDKRIEAFLY